MVVHPVAPIVRNPAHLNEENELDHHSPVARVIDQLDSHLRRRGYTPRKIQRCRNDLWLTGELATSVESGDLRPADEGEATESYVNALPTVSFDDPAWGDDDGHWEPTDQFAQTRNMIDYADAPDASITLSPDYAERLLADGITLQPVCGGGPDEPSAQDWEDYRQWSDSLAVKRWLASNPSFQDWLEMNGGER